MSTAPTVRSDTMPQAIPVNEGRRRVVVEGVQPTVDGGRFPAKQAVGDEVVVEADVFCDGHDAIAVVARYRREADSEAEWQEIDLEPLGNDRWRGRFPVDSVGAYRFAVAGWVDRFASWRRDFVKRADAGQDLSVDSQIGAQHRRRRGPPGQGIRRPLAQDLGGPDPRRPDRRARRRPGREAGHAGAPERRPQPRDDLGGVPAVGRPRPGPLLDLVRAVPPLGRAPRAPTAPSRTSSSASTTSPSSASTSSTCRRSTRSARSSARGRTTTPSPSRATSAARGPSAAPRAATPRSTPSSAPSRTSSTWWRARASAASTSRSTWPTTARPTTRGSRSTPSGSGPAPTARSSTPRTRPRSTRTSTRSTSRRRPGASSGRPSRTSSATGSSRAYGSSGSTTRTPRPFRSGSG